MVDPKFSEILEKLSIFWWSTRHPDKYLISQTCGLGLIAKEDYAAFNIAWALHSPLDTHEAHVRAIPDFNRARTVLNEAVGPDLMLRDLVTMKTLPEFLHWYAMHRRDVSVAGKNLLDRLLVKYRDESNI